MKTLQVFSKKTHRILIIGSLVRTFSEWIQEEREHIRLKKSVSAANFSWQ